MRDMAHAGAHPHDDLTLRHWLSRTERVRSAHGQGSFGVYAKRVGQEAAAVVLITRPKRTAAFAPPPIDLASCDDAHVHALQLVRRAAGHGDAVRLVWSRGDEALEEVLHAHLVKVRVWARARLSARVSARLETAREGRVRV